MVHKNQTRRDFIKASIASTTTIAVGPTLAEASIKIGTSLSKKTSYWENWARNISFKPEKIIPVTSPKEISELIKHPHVTSVRVAGAGHSSSAIVPGRILLTTKSLASITVNPKEMTVTVGAGAILKDVIETLNHYQLAFPTMSDIATQTMAGLAATGTKGNGAQFGSMVDADSLLGVTVIDGVGNVNVVDFLKPENRELAAALRLNLGSLGVITSLTFRVVPAYRLHEEILLTDLATALSSAKYLNSYQYSFFYFPYSDVAKTYTSQLTEEKPDLKMRKHRKFQVDVMENKLADILIKAGSLCPSKIPSISKLFASTLKNETYVDNWNHVMVQERTMKYFEMNYTIPAQHLTQFLARFKTIVNEMAHSKTYYSDLPLYVRFVRGDRNVFLANNQGHGVFAHININAHPAQKNYHRFFKAIEQEFIQLDGRPHWGKIFYVNPAASYPALADFEKVRNQLDPENKFQNDFVKTYLKI